MVRLKIRKCQKSKKMKKIPIRISLDINSKYICTASFYDKDAYRNCY
jgi:hypothetical protein